MTQKVSPFIIIKKQTEKRDWGQDITRRMNQERSSPLVLAPANSLSLPNSSSDCQPIDEGRALRIPYLLQQLALLHRERNPRNKTMTRTDTAEMLQMNEAENPEPPPGASKTRKSVALKFTKGLLHLPDF